MRALLLAALLVAPALAGCTGRGGDPPTGPMCFTRGDASAEWDQPGLFEQVAALAQGAPRNGVQVEPHEPTARIPFSSPALDARWERYSLVALDYRPDPDGPQLHASALRPGELLLQARFAWEDAQRLDALAGFLDAAGLADAPERAGWERGLLGSTVSPWSSVVVLAEPDLSAVAEALERDGFEEAPGSLGNAAVVVGPWTLHLQLAQLRLTQHFVAPPVTLVVDVDDHVLAWTMMVDGERPWPALQTRVNETFRTFGFGEPAWHTAQGRPGMC